MSTKNKLPFSNQFERGHSFNWAGKWEIGRCYMNDEYVTDFVVYENAILACRKTHTTSEDLKPILVIVNGKVVDVDSPFWEFVVASNENDIIQSSTYIAAATIADKEKDPSVIIGDPYIYIQYASGAYLYVPAKDLVVGINVGIPIMTQEMLDNLPPESIPDQYILMAQESDIKDATGGNYLPIIFSALRKLQAEVAKLRNSFSFGVESYTGKNTAVSATVAEIKEDKDEPLWSIDETDLSEIPESTIDFYAPTINIVPHANIEYDGSGYVKILAPATWSDEGGYENIEDTKIFLYLTTTSPKVKVILNGLNSNEVLTVDLNQILNTPVSEKYNICVLVSRKMTGEDGIQYGKNYIWISASHFSTNVTIAEGYLNTATNKLSSSLIEINDQYTIHSVEFGSGTLTKFNAYSQYQDFSHEVVPSKPTDQDYKYKAAHITIRAVDTLDELEEIEDRLLTNELIYQNDNNILWIKTNNGLSAISGGGSGGGGMTVTEMLEELGKRGLIYNDNGTWQISDISDITFINNQTGKKFKFEVSASGDLVSQEIPKQTLEQIISSLTDPAISTSSEIRGFVGKLHLAQSGKSASISSDAKLDSDRVKIGAVYCPLSTDTKFGCSHGYIELENTSDRDFPLEGCYLHYLHPNEVRTLIVDSLPLTGTLPAGGTYLIRCKQYADSKLDADVFINVDTYDQEWYKDGELMDLTIDQEYVTTQSGSSPVYPYDFALTYLNTVGDNPITPNTSFITTDASNNTVYVWNFIDVLPIDKRPNDSAGWGAGVASSRSNTIIRNTFELDPAKQAYQALYSKDSSRLRLAKIDNDIQYLDLTSEYIEFPATEDIYPVSKFTPKASFEHKNVCTDKSKIDTEKPNMVTCSFGINTYTTRAFNWISAGEFDEYVFIKDGDVWDRFESYKEQSDDRVTPAGPLVRVEFTENVANSIYKRIVGNFPGDNSHYTAHKCIVRLRTTPVTAPVKYTYVVGRADKNGNPDFEHCSEEHTFTLYPQSYSPRIYQITDQQGFHWIEYQVWSAAAQELNKRITNDLFVEVLDPNVSEIGTYLEKDADGEYNYTTDSAINLEKTYYQYSGIIPVLINTGDMTQNGTRINEWFDYYNAGRVLFKHLEQMNVVGNNDLCNTDVNALGTGDDGGKSNSYYFHVFYCYEINEENRPLINNGTVDLYVPSLYYFDFVNYRIVMINSEITYINCDKWFNRHKNEDVVNVYTGWTVPSTAGGASYYDGTFKSIYSMLYDTFDDAINEMHKNVIAVCHEMPFTVITKDSLEDKESVYSNYRSLGAAGTSLIGSHTNQLNSNDKIGIHWLSRLLEYFQIKLMIGGHKHTYACTFPLREYYFYYDVVDDTIDDSNLKNSKDDGPMTMYRTLELDDRVMWFTNDNHNLTKLPLCATTVSGDQRTGVISWGTSGTMNVFSPTTIDTNLTGGVTYLMCQATGYKLTSNKELPSNWQHFSNLIPKTSVKSDGSDGPDVNQRKPMYMIIDMNGNNYIVQLIRLNGILNSSNGFTQINNTPVPVNIVSQWATIPAPSEGVSSSRYATWNNSKANLISI